MSPQHPYPCKENPDDPKEELIWGKSAICKMSGTMLENVEHFKYLGSWVSWDTPYLSDKEIQFRINSANAAFGEHRTLLTDFRLALSSRIQFLNALVRSRLCYGAHSWCLRPRDINRIDAAYRSHLRSMLRGGNQRVKPPSCKSCRKLHKTSKQKCAKHLIAPEEVDWRYKITNDKLLTYTKTVNISTFTQRLQRNWISHII